MRRASFALSLVLLTLVTDHVLQGGHLRRQILYEAHAFGYSMQRTAATAVGYIAP